MSNQELIKEVWKAVEDSIANDTKLDLVKAHIKLGKAYQTCGQAKWISVDDRLPKGEESVLVTYDGKVEKTCMAYGEWLMPSKRQIESITHWMPLPEPPK